MAVTQICILAWAILGLIVVAVLLRLGGRSDERTRETRDGFGARRADHYFDLDAAQMKNPTGGGKKPSDIPVHPEITYAKVGWSVFRNWLGTGRIKW